MKSLFMETTRINPEQTVGEIQRVLGLYGAAAIRTDYENGEVIGVSFLVRVNGQEIPFRLPCRWEMIFKYFRNRRKRKHSIRLEEEDQRQAKRVAWRQILRCINAHKKELTKKRIEQIVSLKMKYSTILIIFVLTAIGIK